MGIFLKIPPYGKENKASSRAEDDAESMEVGTQKKGHWSDLGGGQGFMQKILENKV